MFRRCLGARSSRSLWKGLALSFVITLAETPAQAQGQITILSAQPDLAKNELVVRASKFQSGTRIFLFLNPAVELQVVSLTTAELHAKMPAPFPTGTFLLAAFHPATGQVGFFSLAIRTAFGENVLIDSTGKTIGNLDSEPPIWGPFGPSREPRWNGGSVITLKASDRRLRVKVAPGGFRSAMFTEVVHRDSACSSPHVPDTNDLFVDQAVVTLSDGSAASDPPYGTIAWVPDYTQSIWSCGDGLPYMRNSDGACVQRSPSVCGVQYRPAIRIDLSGFVAPFSAR